jgi:hypothetical protein
MVLMDAEGWTLREDVGERVDDPDYGRHVVYWMEGIINASCRFWGGGRNPRHDSVYRSSDAALGPGPSYGKSHGG